MTATATEVPTAPTSPVDLAQNAEAAKGAGKSKVMPPLESVCGARDCVMEPKYDGWRLLVHRDEDGVHFYTRSGECQDGKLPHIEAELMEALPPGTWLDGEVAALTVNGTTVVNDWNGVQKALGCGVEKARTRSAGLTFVAFDLIAHGGIDARGLPFRSRRKLLERIYENEGFVTTAITAQVEPTDTNLETLIGQGFEGGVVKDLDAKYASGKRGAGWTKMKPNTREDGFVIGFKDGEAGFTGLVGALIIGQYDENGEVIERGRCSGMDMKTRKAVSADREKYLGMCFEFAHEGATVNSVRFPQWKRWRPDKPQAECVVGQV